MKTRYNTLLQVLLFSIITLFMGCDRELDQLEATFPDEPMIFDDGFSSGLNYSAFGGSDVTAFDVDDEVSYEGEASMRFDIPNAGNSDGEYAGGVFYTDIGRDLSRYDALTFWLKASQSSSIDLLGFGNDLDESIYQVSVSDLSASTKWTQVIIPIPDASKLTNEQGMFIYSDAPENDQGYTYWIDEMQFERLGTIAHTQASIQSGEDTNIDLVTGVSTQIDGLSATFNMPNGLNQSVTLNAAYFDYASSDSTVATVDQYGNVTTLSSGISTITATLDGTDASGSLTIQSSGDLPQPTDPTLEADSVISLFSNVYTDVTVDTWNPFWEFSTTQISEFAVDGNDVKLYTSLNFVGIVFSSSLIDASDMTHLHMDVYTQDSSTSLDLTTEIIDFGSDGAFDGDDDSSISSTNSLTTGEWVSVEIDISGLSSRANLAQLVLSADDNLNNIFIDNVYFYDSGTETIPSGSQEAATTPPDRDAADVIAVFSDAYTELPESDYPDWGQATVLTNEQIESNSTLKLAGFDYQGIEFSSAQDLSGMTYLHLDYWTANVSNFNVYLISNGPSELGYNLSVPTSGWQSVDILLSEFSSAVDLADVIQMKFDDTDVSSGDIYLDNIYFYTSNTGPSEAATTPPTRDAADVLAIFSESYTELAGSDYPDWGQTTVLTNEQIDGNATLKLANFNYQGIQLLSAQDVSGMAYLHIDYWTDNATTLNVYLVNSNAPAEQAYALTVPTSGWQSVDILLSEFSSVVDLTIVDQMKFDGDGDIYFDNIYFYALGTTPVEAATTPPSRDATEVMAVFSDAYTEISGTDYPNWGQATVLTNESIADNATLKMTGLNYQGIQLSGAQDVSAMTHLHMDYWTVNSTALNVYLINSGVPIEQVYALTVPTLGWQSVDIPLSEFSSVVDLTIVDQMKFDGDGDIYFDNIYFYKE